MNTAVRILLTVDILVITLLPVMFFRRGRHGLTWWLTAVPLIVAGLTIIAPRAVLAVDMSAAFRSSFDAAAVVAGASALMLLGFTLGTHERPLALWHQDDDAPEHLVTSGAYARIRHPFYASFLLVLSAVALAAPGIPSFVALAWGVVALNLTARREERRLLASVLGVRYAAYMARTGRFMPRLLDAS
jgi:protein-S-isoprenylcysteine O-methyltransferase Ste14